MNNEELNNENQDNNKSIVRKEDDLKLIEQLKSSPELFITERGSDKGLDKLSLKVKLICGREFMLSDYIANEMAKHHTKFFKDWYYRLADLLGIPRSAMDAYIKPEFVRLFTIQFVYARFPYLLLRSLRKRKRKSKIKGKLFQYLKKDVSENLDKIINDVYEIMGVSKNLPDFKKNYGDKYQMYYEVELF